MAASGFTPIQLYRTTTAAAVPVNTNLADGELAINTTDEKLFFKNAAGTVKVIAGTGGAGVVAGSNTQVQFNNSGVFGAYANLTFNGTTLSAAGLSDSGNLAFTGTGNRITGDFDNATFSNRPMFQTSTVNGNTSVSAIPNGTNTNSNFTAYGASDANNTNRLQFAAIGGAEARITSDFTGTGAYHPMTFYTGGSERLRIDTSGNVGIGTSSPTQKLDVNGVSRLADSIYGVGSIELGSQGTGDRVAYLDFHSSGTPGAIDNSARIIRNAGVNGSLSIEQTGTGSIDFVNGGSQRLTITSAGNVGIGTSSPAAIGGTLSVVANGNTGTGYFRNLATSGITSDQLQVSVSQSTSLTSFYFSRFYSNVISSPTVMHYIRGDGEGYFAGNVGIGTATTTNGNLTVQQASATTGGPILSLWNSNATAGNTCGYLRFLSNTSVRAQIHSVVDTGAPFNGNLIFSTGEGTLSERMRIDFSGNLLMGTTLARSFLTFSYGTSTGNGATLVNTNAGNNTTKYNTINFVGTDTVGTGKDSGYIRSIPFDANYVASVLTFATRDADVLAERMSIGSTGIVTMNAYGAGAATFSAAGVISSVSDETWKTKDGVPVDPDAMLKKLEPGYWYYNDEKKPIFGADRQLGFYAQNVNAAIGPEAAPTPEEGKPWGYYDRSVLAVAVMSLQKALATIESLEARVAALESN